MPGPDTPLWQRARDAARRLLGEHLGRRSLGQPAALIELGARARDAERYEDAAALWGAALQLLERALGVQDPRLAPLLEDLAGALSMAGDLAGARRLVARARSLVGPRPEVGGLVLT